MRGALLRIVAMGRELWLRGYDQRQIHDASSVLFRLCSFFADLFNPYEKTVYRRALVGRLQSFFGIESHGRSIVPC